jgi:hypothetical protein
LITTGLLLSLGTSLRADYEQPGVGPNLDALSGEDGGQAWDLWIRTYVGYDDNVQFVSDGNPFFAGDRESGYLGLTLEGVYRFMDQGNVDAGAALRVDKVYFMEGLDSVAGPGWVNEANNYDLSVVEPALYLNFRNEGGTIPFYGRATYSFRWEETEESGIGGEGHNLGIMLGTEVSPCLHAELSYLHGWDDFDINRADPDNERDGERDRISFSLIQPGSESGPQIVLRYSYLSNDSDGKNFRYDGHELMFRVEGQVSERVGAAFQVSYADLDYPDAVASGLRTESDVMKAGVQLVYSIDENWTADLYYNYLEVDSDTAIYDGERNDVGMGLRYDF